MNKKFVPVPVAENLTWEEFSRVNLHLPYLPGMQPDVGETRDYPFGDELVHILGYVAAVSPEDMKHDDDPLLSMPGYPHRQARHRKAVRQARCAARPAPAGSRSTPMAASSASWARIRASRARMSISPSTARCSASPTSSCGSESAACVVMDVQQWRRHRAGVHARLRSQPVQCRHLAGRNGTT